MTIPFFINTNDNAFLDFSAETDDGWGYCVFGKVIDGMDVVREIHAQDADGPSDSPYTQGQMLTQPVRIERAFRATD